MRRFVVLAFLIGVVGFWFLSRPTSPFGFSQDQNAPIAGDTEAGELVAIAAGCTSCHGADLAGYEPENGEAIYSPFGTFYAPNITPAALSDWDFTKFELALRSGVVDGKHLYPAFPYRAYAGMNDQDAADLWAYLQNLPSVAREVPPNALSLVSKWRRPVGIWKRLAASAREETDRGAYIAENLAHCQECHTPRNALGILKKSEAYQGGLTYGSGSDVKGKVPDLITGESASWSKSELVEYFTSGFTPNFDSAGGKMVGVIENLAKLPESDREALADYLIKIRE